MKDRDVLKDYNKYKQITSDPIGVEREAKTCLCSSHLQPLGEDEWDKVAEVHGLTAGPPACVQEELLAFLHVVQYHSQIPVGEKHPAPQEVVSRSPGHRLETGQQGRINF